jgi:glycosyltransferase involved in cell wall biosynthesis
MKKVAIVVQRCHESVVGGSESLAWHYATLLRESYAVDVLTTTAVDISDWANCLPPGVESRDGINIHRFSVTLGRTPYWEKLLQRLFADFQAYGLNHKSEVPRSLPWTISLQEEFIKTQGPYSAGLMKFLAQKWRDYQAILFITYLYPTTYFGLLQVPPGCAFIVPTLHNEQTAYLSAYKHAARRARSLIWLTEAEKRVGSLLWGDLPGRVVAMSIDAMSMDPLKLDLAPAANLENPYVLYSGRIDPNKGCVQLFQYFMEFKRKHPSKLRLVLTGKDDMPVPPHSDIDFRGFVSAEEKLRLMAGAKIFVMPSGNESFSIVTLEAMAQRTPVLASSTSEVLSDHIKLSGAGRIYQDYESFAVNLEGMLGDEQALREMGETGRAYVISNYAPERVQASLIEVVESTNQMTANNRALRETPASHLSQPASFSEL